jgi:hypothetical protein
MWEPQPLTPLWAFTACYRDSFTFFLLLLLKGFSYTVGLKYCDEPVIHGLQQRCVDVCKQHKAYATLPLFFLPIMLRALLKTIKTNHEK